MTTLFTASFDSALTKHGERIYIFRIVSVTPSQVRDANTYWAHAVPLKSGEEANIIVDNISYRVVREGDYLRQLTSKEIEQRLRNTPN